MKQLNKSDFIESDILELLRQIRNSRKEKERINEKIKKRLARIKKLKRGE